MINRIVACIGSPYDSGKLHGSILANEIKQNVTNYRALALAKGYNWQKLLDSAKKDGATLAADSVEEIRGISNGANLPFLSVLSYNFHRDMVIPEGCTVVASVGSSSADGNTIFMKNSDKLGDDKLVGPNCHMHKEINVIRIIKPEKGNIIIGVGAAGGTGIKMGLNNKGVATGSNIARTKELASKTVNRRVTGRDQIMKESLTQNSAYDAAKFVLEKVSEAPMGTPGNLHFADPREVVVVEGSYNRTAIARIRDDVHARANGFVLMKDLNDDKDVSSFTRYNRAMELLKASKGKITVDTIKSISMDHEYGPSSNSICRHAANYLEETTGSTAIMAINGSNPALSEIHIALGKPCLSWRDKEGHIKLKMDVNAEQIPSGFLDGSIWKKFYVEEVKAPDRMFWGY